MFWPKPLQLVLDWMHKISSPAVKLRKSSLNVHLCNVGRTGRVMVVWHTRLSWELALSGSREIFAMTKFFLLLLTIKLASSEAILCASRVGEQDDQTLSFCPAPEEVCLGKVLPGNFMFGRLPICVLAITEKGSLLFLSISSLELFLFIYLFIGNSFTKFLNTDLETFKSNYSVLCSAGWIPNEESKSLFWRISVGLSAQKFSGLFFCITKNRVTFLKSSL